jgi:serine/threonine protein kinase
MMKCPQCLRENPEDTRFCGNCGAPLAGASGTSAAFTQTFQTPRELVRGTTFAGRYEIIEELGRGGMGKVYKAYDSKIRENVALKLLRPEIGSDEETIERFRNEIKLARRISQRHVCRMFDLGEEGMAVFITMEFVPGENLKSFIRRSGNLTEAKAVGLARQICEGLAEAHRLGVIHRDLKPQNVMIDKEGNARIMDFGIASSVSTRGLTGTGSIIGTPEYMSPEQAEGRNVDARSDIYSAGVILFEMVTGRVPFEGETPLSVAIKHKSEPPRDPRALNSQISPTLSRLILKCLEKSRSSRYQTADDLRDELEALEKGFPTAERAIRRKKPTTTREVTIKFDARKILKPALSILGVLVLGAIGLWIRSNKNSVRSLQSPVRPAESSIAADPSGAGSHREEVSASILAPLLREASKYIEPKDFQTVEKMMAALKAKLPSGDPLLIKWDAVQKKFEDGQKQQKAGNLDASRKSYTRSQSEMNKLLAEVSAKEAADAARTELEAARKRADASVATRGDNLLHWIASEKEKDASDAYSKSDFSGAKTLYAILARIYGLSLQGGTEDDCLARLRGFVAGIRRDADAVRARPNDSWLYDRASEEEARAAAFLKEKRYAESAEFYVLSAFLYEKARDVALENSGSGN